MIVNVLGISNSIPNKLIVNTKGISNQNIIDKTKYQM